MLCLFDLHQPPHGDDLLQNLVAGHKRTNYTHQTKHTMSPRSLLVFWVLCYCKALASDDAGQLVSTAQAAVNLAAVRLCMQRHIHGVGISFFETSILTPTLQSNAQAALDRLRQNCAAIPNEESEEVRRGVS